MAAKPPGIFSNPERPFLGEALNRLQRMLGVTGRASPVFEDGSRIVPTVSVGDGTLPGMGQQSLRRFITTGRGIQNAGATTTAGFQATRDCIITRVCYTISAASTTQTLRFFGPAETLPYALATASGVFIDRAQAGNESSPLLFGFDNTGIAVNGTSIFSNQTQAAQVGTLLEAIRSPFLLGAGAAFILRHTTVNIEVNINVEGMAL